MDLVVLAPLVVVGTLGSVAAAGVLAGCICDGTTASNVKAPKELAQGCSMVGTEDILPVNTVAELTKTVDVVQESVEKLRFDYQVLANQLAKVEKQCVIQKYVLSAAIASSLVYAHMRYRGISVSDVTNGAKRGAASILSNVTKRFGEKSATITEKLRDLTEQIEKFGKPDEPKLREEIVNSNTDKEKLRGLTEQIEKFGKPDEQKQREETIDLNKNELQTDLLLQNYRNDEQSDHLFELVTEVGHGFSNKILWKALDHLNHNDAAARSFINKPQFLRKIWLSEFERVCQ